MESNGIILLRKIIAIEETHYTQLKFSIHFCEDADLLRAIAIVQEKFTHYSVKDNTITVYP